MREVRNLKASEVLALEPTLEEIDSWFDAQYSGTWFTSDLLRLIQKADVENRSRLGESFPGEVAMFKWWLNRVDARYNYYQADGKTPVVD